MTEKTMDEMGIPAVAPAKGGLRRRVWFWGILLAVLGLPPLFFLVENMTADRTSIPPELVQLPPKLALTQTSFSPGEATRDNGNPNPPSPAPVDGGLLERKEKEGMHLSLLLLSYLMVPDVSDVPAFSRLHKTRETPYA